MDEEVATALVRRDEAETLLVVEPLHNSGRHAFKHLSLCALLGALRVRTAARRHLQPARSRLELMETLSRGTELRPFRATPPWRQIDAAAARAAALERRDLHRPRSEEHTSELQSPCNLVCRLLL